MIVVPKPPRRPTPEWWKDLFRAWLKANPDWSQQKVEQRIGAGEGAISKMLRPSMGSSGMVTAICSLTGLPSPEDGEPTSIVQRVAAALHTLKSEQLQEAAVVAFEVVVASMRQSEDATSRPTPESPAPNKKKRG